MRAVTTIVFVLAASAAHAANCPQVSVTSPDMVNAGEKASYVASVSGGDANVTPTYNWTVSNGAIESGQGTSVIDVNTEGVDGTITATVDVGGYERECATSSSATLSVMAKREAKQFDHYGAVGETVERTHLDELALKLTEEYDANVHLIGYDGTKGKAGTAAKALERAKSYLVTRWGVDPGRIVTAVGTAKRPDLAVELWIVPNGATAPVPEAAKPASTKAPPKPTPAPTKPKS